MKIHLSPVISKVLIPSNAIDKIFTDSRFVMGYPQKRIVFKMPYLKFFEIVEVSDNQRLQNGVPG